MLLSKTNRMDSINLNNYFEEHIVLNTKLKISNKKRHFRVDISVVDIDDYKKKITVKVVQYSLFPGKIWSSKHLYEMGKEVFRLIEELGYKVHIRQNTYEGPLTSYFNVDGVKYFLDRHGISQQTMAEALGTNKQQISRLLNGVVQMTAYTRAACFYWIQYLYASGDEIVKE